MDIDISLAWQVVTGLSVALALSLLVLYKLTKAYGRLRSEKRSGEVRRGFMTEQWLPLVEPYPWDPHSDSLGALLMAFNLRRTRLY